MEKRSKELTDAVITLKKSTYSLVEKYTRMALMLKKDKTMLNPHCVKVMGRVGDDGIFFVTKETEEAFTNSIISKCVDFAKEWIQFFQMIDLFVEKLFEFKDVTHQLRKNNNIYFKRICEYWCGDAEDVDGPRNGVSGLLFLAENIDELSEEVDVDSADVFYEKYCSEDVLEGVFRIFSREYPRKEVK